MKLNKYTIFSGIIVLGLITNLSVLYDIQHLFLRGILSFVFLTFIPGLLIILMLKVKKLDFWEYLIYTVGLSLAFIMFTGVGINWILPWLNITKTPLSLIPLLIGFNIILSIIWIIAFIRNRDILVHMKFPKIDFLNVLFFLIPLVFPVLSIFGAILLNNGGSNHLTISMLSSVCAYVFFVVIFRNKLNKNIYPLALFLIIFALITMGSMRSWYISHTDATLERHYAYKALTEQIWGNNVIKNSYDAMLSVTILPAVYSIFSNVNVNYILKLFFPFLFSFIAPILLYIYRKLLTDILAFLGVLFFLFQPTITAWTLLSPRQEIAFVFLGLILLNIFNKNLKHSTKNILFLIFGLSMIVSHYSTTYVALVIFLFTYILIIIYRIIKNRKKNLEELIQKEENDLHFNGIILLCLFIFTYIWYSLVTNTTGSLISFSKKSFNNFNKVFSNEVYSEGNSPLEYLNILGIQNIGSSANYHDSLEDYISAYNIKFVPTSNYDKNRINTNKYSTYLTQTSYLPSNKYSFEAYYFSEKLKQVLLVFGGLFIFLGLIFYLYKFYKKRESNQFFLFFSFSFIISFIFIILLPFASTYYNLNRLYQQDLVILAVLFVLGFMIFFPETKKTLYNIGLYLLLIFLILYFIAFTHVQYYFIGGREVQLRFANVGKDYDLQYVSAGEIRSINWLYINKQQTIPIVIDTYATYKMYQADKYNELSPINTVVLPENINSSDYVYSSRTNTKQKITFKFFDRGLLIYNYPTEFLNDNKNKIYSNNISEIYK